MDDRGLTTEDLLIMSVQSSFDSTHLSGSLVQVLCASCDSASLKQFGLGAASLPKLQLANNPDSSAVMVGMDSKLRRHFQHLSDTFGHSTCEDLKELGKDKVATDLHAAVAACTLQQYSAALAPAHAVVQAAWEVLQETGWDHPAWREAYSLAQLCLAAAYTLPELTTTASACTQPIPTSSDSAPNSPGSKAPTSEPGQPHAAAPSGRPRSSAIHSSPPALGHSQLPQNNAQTKSPPEIAKPDSHRQGSMKQDSLACSCLKKDSSDPASPRKSSSKQVIPELDSHIMKAMQALDLASILGAPPEMLAPLLSTTEPLAKQAHQASLAQQNRLPLQQRHCTPPADPSSHQQRDSMHKRQTSSAQHTRCQAYRGDQEDQFRCACISSEQPEDLPHLEPDKMVARRSAAGLTAAEFKRLYWKTDKPVIVTGGMQNWKAMQKWSSLQWWSQHHGHRTIPVELGTDSTDTWSETTMLLHAFMRDYMHPSMESQPDAEVAYIAQHPLFDQMPSLLSDFDEPELMGGDAMQMNAWVGTKGTITPLHFDSYDNFLAQVAGFKFVRLYNRQQSRLLYVNTAEAGHSAMRATRAQGNISAVNVEHPDLEKHPNFIRAKYWECILCPGEMLFIPAKCWHYVRSLSPAVSLNFWY